MKQVAVVAIGFSAGGQRALQLFFDNTPLDDTAYVVLSKLPPGYTSKLQLILQSHSTLEIVHAAQGTVPVANRVYILKQAAAIILEHGEFSLRTWRTGEAVFPLDVFLASLAASNIKKTAAVILSGDGTDGAVGIRLLKKKKGKIIAQMPATCEFDGMPRAAIATGLVDEILPPQMIPGFLLGCLQKDRSVNINDSHLLLGIGEAIKKARKEQSLSQVALSLASGMQKASLSRIEAGKENMTLSTVRRIALALKVNIRVLLSKG